MKKMLAAVLAVVLMVGVVTACTSNDVEESGAESGIEQKNAEAVLKEALFSDEEISTVNEDNTEAYINGEKMDAAKAADLEAEAEEMANNNTALPDGFPNSVPIYAGAVILEAEPYGDNGYTLVYQVGDGYNDVMDFYRQSISGLDESYIGEDEAYFENFDIDGGKVHINGLTISGFDDGTQVFITLKKI